MKSLVGTILVASLSLANVYLSFAGERMAQDPVSQAALRFAQQLGLATAISGAPYDPIIHKSPKFDQWKLEPVYTITITDSNRQVHQIPKEVRRRPVLSRPLNNFIEARFKNKDARLIADHICNSLDELGYPLTAFMLQSHLHPDTSDKAGFNQWHSCFQNTVQ